MNPEKKQCPACFGTGYVVRGIHEPRLDDCDFCGGKGEVFVDYDKTDALRRRPKPTQ